MKKKKYTPQYIAACERQISNILNDKAEYDDWTQICFSMKDAVCAAATVWGNFTDEQKHTLACFIREMSIQEINNVREFDITFKKKES